MNFYCNLLIIFFFCLSSTLCWGQECHVIINDSNSPSLLVSKSSNYQQYLDSLTHIGYYTTRIDSLQSNPCNVYITKGKQFKRIYINSLSKMSDSLLKVDTINELPYTNNLDTLIEHLNKGLNNSGKIFSTIDIKPIGYIKNYALVDLVINESEPRSINNIRFIGYTKMPKFVKRQLLSDNDIYNDSSIAEIQTQLDSYNFFNITQTSKIAFTKDSTILYVYANKIRQNTFDGLIGFETNEDDQLNLKGYVDINLRNAFNRGESISLQWKSGTAKSQRFTFTSRLPYIFNTDLGIRTSLNITKQDSTFINLGVTTELNYYFQPNHSMGVNYNYALSNYIVNEENSLDKDFNKNGWGLSYNYANRIQKTLNQNITNVAINSSLWNKKLSSDNQNETQTEIIYEISQQQRIWKNHFLYVKLFGGNLLSKSDKTLNDMYQIGGYNSLRGYNQNSIFTPSYNFSSLAYRFIPNEKILFEAFTDIGFIEKANQDNYEFLQAYGLGTSFRTNIGIFQLSYALPTQSNYTGLANGKVHIGIKTLF